MKRRTAATALSAAALLLLTGCGSSAADEAAQAVFDECDRPDAPTRLLEVDGSDVVLEVAGETARGIADGDVVTSMVLLLDMKCVLEATNFPGSAEQLADGDEWDGWRASVDEGAGSEVTYVFTATG